MKTLQVIHIVLDLIILASLLLLSIARKRAIKKAKEARLSVQAHTDDFLSSLDNLRNLFEGLKKECGEAQKPDRLHESYMPDKRGDTSGSLAIPANGIIYTTVNNKIGWLKVRGDGFPWMFTKLADSGEWCAVEVAKVQNVADCIASAVPDDVALAIKTEAYQREQSNANYMGERMIKNYQPL